MKTNRDIRKIAVITDNEIPTRMEDASILYQVGTIERVLEDGQVKFIMEMDEDRFKYAQKTYKCSELPGFMTEYGWRQVHNRLPSFIEQRTYSSQRPDIEELLSNWGMTPKTYSKWELVKKSKGAYMDRWRLLPMDEETL